MFRFRLRVLTEAADISRSQRSHGRHRSLQFDTDVESPLNAEDSRDSRVSCSVSALHLQTLCVCWAVDGSHGLLGVRRLIADVFLQFPDQLPTVILSVTLSSRHLRGRSTQPLLQPQ
ncbi:unnamed protein product [Lota lota]